jgi:hypothetical protein
MTTSRGLTGTLEPRRLSDVRVFRNRKPGLRLESAFVVTSTPSTRHRVEARTLVYPTPLLSSFINVLE